ncbi:hypothetical protein B0F90DRAFT_1364587 [Multifurca ochricompacta]|uniref:Uncharacterized protein n=1 Tax=Multifurca ochricompacta TaxID=376703 RepID=A0AAD4M821_9AGAM|nr:hypothetical protein B0F90DRAFT_1364587 [Multifurca ochricompacta]
MTTTTTSLSPSADISSLTSSIRWATDYLSDEDEIVWSLSSSAILSSSPPLNSPLSETADFVLVSRIDTSPATVTTTAAAALNGSTISDTIAKEMAALSLSPTPQPHRRTDLSPVPKPAPAPLKESSSTANKGGGRKATIHHPLLTNNTLRRVRPRCRGLDEGKQRRKRGLLHPHHLQVASLPLTPRRHCPSRNRLGPRQLCQNQRSAYKRKMPPPSSVLPDPPTAKGAEKSSTGLGLRSIVYDLVTGLMARAAAMSSPAINAATTTGTTTTTGYQEAHKYMTSCVQPFPSLIRHRLIS